MKGLTRYILMAVLMICTLALPLKAESHKFEVRALHIDLRTQVMTVKALKQTAQRAAQNGLNTLIMEWEATFPFQENGTLRNREAYTQEEVKEFIRYAEALGIDVIPLQNCFGHCEYILRHDRYAGIREDSKDYSQVCPLKLSRDKEVFRSIFKEITSLHHSKYFHIGADETRLLGKCRRCASFVKEKGVSRLFAEYVSEMCSLVKEMGKIPVIWDDMILRHPECIDLLPKDIVVIDWNYGWDPSRFGDIDRLIKSGFTIWGATALRSAPDDVFQTNWPRHFSNLSRYIPFARENRFSGIVQTSWSTSGEYGYTWDANGLIDLQPVRQVYPLDGFGILIDAFGEAVLEQEPLECEDFITGYCKERFGLDEAGAKVMMAMFDSKQNPALIGGMHSEVTLTEQLDQCKAMLRGIQALRPSRNRDEFAHFKLMLQLRKHYLEFRIMENREEAEHVDVQANSKEFVIQLDRLRKEGKKLLKRFNKAHSSYLKDPSCVLGEDSYLNRLEKLIKKYSAK